MPSSLSSSKMFHTFQGLAPPRPLAEHNQETPKPATNGTSKRITTPHACAECKRRKIRCDGRQPCGQCLGCRSPKPCYYDKHRQRVIPSRKTLDALSQSLEECRSILKRLYPTRDTQSLLPLSRSELISLLDRTGPHSNPSQRSPTGSNLSPSSQEFHSPIATSATDDNQSLAHLEQIPSQDTEWDEERRSRDPIPAEADDVNALSLSVDRQTSYLGATSIKAAFLVMLKVAPVLRSFLAPSNTNKQQLSASNYPTPRPGSSVQKSLSPITWSSEGQTLIDAYFNRVQIFIPMLDEPSFRADYLAGRRNDAPWLALLNMVFVMGSIVATKSDDHNHINYYNRAKEHLGIDTFGSGHLETLQALGLMGGLYLHYINRPNMANAILGAALRMACAMGLHRECPPEPSNTNPMIVEQRRRTWWSLFCLDTWASTTLGRPSMGRWGPGITINPPEGGLDPNTAILPLIENIKFCKIATSIQDALALSPLMPSSDRASLDAQLVCWHDSLPWILRSTEPCSENIYTARCIMKWRYQNLRIVLSRPVLLNLANRGADGPPASAEEIEAVETCRAVAKQTIEDIAREWTPNQMLGWNGTWFMYQASMIPLVSIFWEGGRAGDGEGSCVGDWKAQVEVVLGAFEGLGEWSLAARRSREVLGKMFGVCRMGVVNGGGERDGSNVGGMLLTNGNGTNGANGTHNGNGMMIPNGLNHNHNHNHTQQNGHLLTDTDTEMSTHHHHLQQSQPYPSQQSPNSQFSPSQHPHPHPQTPYHDQNQNQNQTPQSQQQPSLHHLQIPHHLNLNIDESTIHLIDQGVNVWDLDGMLWANLPDGLDMPYDGLPMDFEDGGSFFYENHGQNGGYMG